LLRLIANWPPQETLRRLGTKEDPVMKAWSVIGLLFAAAMFAAIPISPQVTARGLELSVDQAQAVTYGRARRVTRRAYRRGYGRAAAYVGALAAGAAAAYGAGYYGGGYGGGYYGAPYYGGFGGYYAPSYGQPVGGGGGQFYYSGYGAPWW
jgi:hypothetical protein